MSADEDDDLAGDEDDYEGAILYAAAEEALLAMEPGPTRNAIRALLGGRYPKFSPEEDIDEALDELPDPRRGWSAYRVYGWVILYKPLTEDQLEYRGRRLHPRAPLLGDTLVSDIIPVDEYFDNH